MAGPVGSSSEARGADPLRASSGPVVLGTDFGAVSTAAERAAIRIAASHGVDLLVVHAIDPGRLRLSGGRWRERLDQARAARERDAAALVERARADGVRARVLIWNGDPATCVVDAAVAEGASRIVVGSHARGRIGRAIAGSVSAEVRGRATCPVEVVRAERLGATAASASRTSR
jgi:nucleotide-binding universal stress UspA family protein